MSRKSLPRRLIRIVSYPMTLCISQERGGWPKHWQDRGSTTVRVVMLCRCLWRGLRVRKPRSLEYMYTIPSLLISSAHGLRVEEHFFVSMVTKEGWRWSFDSAGGQLLSKEFTGIVLCIACIVIISC